MTTATRPLDLLGTIPPECAVNKGTSVFLDRDGVINRRLPGDYVRSWDAFDPLPGAVQAVAALTRRARQVVVVTNQRGVARGLVPRPVLRDIHARLAAAVEAAGGRLAGVLVCPHDHAAACACRKPAPGLVLEAARRWPDIDLARSVLVGDSASDLRCAVAASPVDHPIGRVWVGGGPAPDGPCTPHAVFPSLAAYVSALTAAPVGRS